MKDDPARIGFERLFNVTALITIFYMELSSHFHYEGERHDYWELIYVDKGELLCAAEEKRFLLKSGEMTFHKPGEFHNHAGNSTAAPNVSVLNFECKSPAMKRLEGKIFRLSAQEKSLLSALFSEGMACYRLDDEHDPLHTSLCTVSPSPLGGSQMIKNLLEQFLILLCRSTDAVEKDTRRSYVIDGADVPYDLKELLDYLNDHIYGSITIADLARQLDRSQSSVKQLFARYRPGGVIRYYNALKIREARRLIREGRYNMAQISDLLHFDSPQYFSKCFRQVTNMTPSQYKASILRQ